MGSRSRPSQALNWVESEPDKGTTFKVRLPVLADITWQGAPIKAMFWANRNGNFYVFDRATGKFLHAKPFVRVNWMKLPLRRSSTPLNASIARRDEPSNMPVGL